MKKEQFLLEKEERKAQLETQKLIMELLIKKCT
jgi:hypothetical protein